MHNMVYNKNKKTNRQAKMKNYKNQDTYEIAEEWAIEELRDEWHIRLGYADGQPFGIHRCEGFSDRCDHLGKERYMESVGHYQYPEALDNLIEEVEAELGGRLTQENLDNYLADK